MTKPTGYGGRDSPDFGIGDVGRGMSVNIDGAELAARLGAAQSFSRSGQLLYDDSFNWGLGSWDIVVNESESNVRLYTTSSFRSPYCVRLYLKNVADTWVTMSKSFGYPYLANIGIEITYRTGLNLRSLEIKGVACNATNKQTFGIQVNGKFGRVYYWRFDAGWSAPSGTSVETDDYEHFHTMKCVVDLVNQRYNSIMLDNHRYVPPYRGLEIGSGCDYSYIDFTIRLYQDESMESYVYIDDFIFTINEPD